MTSQPQRMEITINCRLAGALARRMREARRDLTRRWLDRIVAHVNLDPNQVFPTDELLDHVPLLVDRIADYLEDPAEEITAGAPVTGKAMELGEMRYRQGFDAHQLLKEYELLGGVLFAFLVRTVDDIDEPCSRGELLACAQRLFRAISAIEQVTTMHYLRLTNERVREREERLRSFNRTVSHELKNRIGAVLGAGQLLEEPELGASAEQRAKLAGIVVNNARIMQESLENLIELSRADFGIRQQRHVPLGAVVTEVARKLREMAQSRGVELRIDPALPELEVNAAAVELCLTNYLSNAIKYSDPRKPTRWAAVRANLQSDAGCCELIVRVEDNGIGVPPEARGELFEHFFRAHGETVTGIEGTGLGLSIVRDTVESLGGSAWAEFDRPEGSTFCIALPCRREMDPSTATSARPRG